MLGLSLLALSVVFYLLHYMIFRDAHHIFIYLVGDIAFVFVEVMLVTLVIHGVLEQREKRGRLEKINMVIGAFYSGSTVRTYPVGNDNFNVRVKSYYYNTGAGSTGTTLTVSGLAGKTLRVVNDQHCTPTYVPHLARAIAFLVGANSGRQAPWGTYHVTNTGETTWHGFATAIVGGGGRPRVVPIATADYPTPARRPAYGVLATDRFRAAFGFALPPWDEALAACLAAHAAERTD